MEKRNDVEERKSRMWQVSLGVLGGLLLNIVMNNFWVANIVLMPIAPFVLESRSTRPMYLYSLFLLAVTIVIAVLFAHGKREKYPLFTKMFLRTSIIAAFLALLYNLVFLQQGAIIWDVVK